MAPGGFRSERLPRGTHHCSPPHLLSPCLPHAVKSRIQARRSCIQRVMSTGKVYFTDTLVLALTPGPHQALRILGCTVSSFPAHGPPHSPAAPDAQDRLTLALHLPRRSSFQFVTFAERVSLLAQVDDEMLCRADRLAGMSPGPVNQAMAFGAENFPSLAVLLAGRVRDRMAGARPSAQRRGQNVWDRGRPGCGFNQLIANECVPSLLVSSALCRAGRHPCCCTTAPPRAPLGDTRPLRRLAPFVPSLQCSARAGTNRARGSRPMLTWCV